MACVENEFANKRDPSKKVEGAGENNWEPTFFTNESLTW
jgi:hypothetical protein